MSSFKISQILLLSQESGYVADNSTQTRFIVVTLIKKVDFYFFKRKFIVIVLWFKKVKKVEILVT